MEGLIKSDNQKFYDILTSGNLSTAGQGQAIELIMRSLDQEGIQAIQNCLPIVSTSGLSLNNGNPLVNGVSTVSSGSVLSQQQQDGISLAATLGLNLNLNNSVMLQSASSLGMNTSLEQEDQEISITIAGERPHICQVCRASYKTRTHLRRHMFVHLNNRPYPCTDCGKGFNRKEHLNKHIEAVHSGTKYKCQYCGKEISRKDHLSRHIKNMHPVFAGLIKDGTIQDPSILKVELPCGQNKQKSDSIGVCPLSFITPTFPSTSAPPTTTSSGSSAKGNKNSSKSQQQNQLQDGQQQQQTHLILDHSFHPLTQVSLLPTNIVIPGGQVATVSIGNITLSGGGGSHHGPNNNKGNKLQSLNNHNNNNGLVGLTNLSLNLGGQIKEAPFANCGDNKRMILQVFTCTECPATFSSEKEFTAHVKSHKPQNYRCTECPRAYTRREKLTEHIRCFHQGQKFKCEYCGKELSRKDHVLRHVRSIHPEVLASRFTAQLQENRDECGQDGSLSNGNSTAAMNEMGVLLRSVCHVCLKVFGTSYHLSRHIESCHNGDIRPYSCASCSKQFKRKDHLTKHMKSHCPSIREGNQNKNSNNKLHSNNSKSKGNDRNGGHGKGKKTKMLNGSSSTLRIDGQNLSKEDNKTENGEKQRDDGEFNLAMINSFIAENVNVVVEEGDLSSLLIAQEQHEQPSNSSISPVNDNHLVEADMEDIKRVTNNNSNNNSSGSGSGSGSNSSLISSQNQMSTFPCGHCQKEFTSRDQLLDHLQLHTSDDLVILQQQQDGNDPGQPHHTPLVALQFSTF